MRPSSVPREPAGGDVGFGDVEDGVEAAGDEVRGEGGGVDQGAAGGLDEGGTALEEGEAPGIEHVPGLGELGGVDGDHVAAGGEFVEACGFGAECAGLGGVDVGVVQQDLQVEGAEQVDDAPADPGGADHADGAPVVAVAVAVSGGDADKASGGGADGGVQHAGAEPAQIDAAVEGEQVPQHLLRTNDQHQERSRKIINTIVERSTSAPLRWNGAERTERDGAVRGGQERSAGDRPPQEERMRNSGSRSRCWRGPGCC